MVVLELRLQVRGRLPQRVPGRRAHDGRGVAPREREQGIHQIRDAFFGGRRPRAVEERRVLSSFRRRRAQVSHVLRELREGVARGPRGRPVPLGAPL